MILTAVEYTKTGRSSTSHTTRAPSWRAVERAIRRMDNFCFPLVALSPREVADAFDDDSDGFHVVGGAGRFALFRITGEWHYADPHSTDDTEVRLWDSDQGYFCKARNVTSLAIALRITRCFYDTGSFARLTSS